jgi:hypothetical protein
MRLLIIFCFLTISPLGFADDISEPGEVEIPSHFHWQEIDATEKLAAYNWIKASKCEYHTKPGTYYPGADAIRKGVEIWADNPGPPEVTKVKNQNCNGKNRKGMNSVCSGEIVCENDSMKITIGEVFCKSLGPKRCPDARSCALSSDISRVQHAQDSQDGKPSVFFGQKFRGWGLSDREIDREVEQQKRIWNNDDDNEGED